jgi:Lipase (class 3)
MLIRSATAPSYAALRPMKTLTTATFPVYQHLAEILASATEHPDPVVAHTLTTCAGYAYSDAETVSMIMARMGLHDNHCLQIAENVDAMFICSTAFLVQSQDGRVVILCYRGTEPVNFINWLTDADISPEKVSFALGSGSDPFEIHGGFYRNVRATRYEIVRALERARNGQSVLADGGTMPHPLSSLYITGHSLGAAMAALMTVMLETDPAYAPIAATLKAAYTFGQPMIGAPDFAAACDATKVIAGRLFRYRYGHDMVPALPPTASGPFAHFGPEYQYLGKEPGIRWTQVAPTTQMGSLVDLAAAPLSFLARQLRTFRNVTFRQSLYDHGPQHYISALTPAGVRSEFGS